MGSQKTELTGEVQVKVRIGLYCLLRSRSISRRRKIRRRSSSSRRRRRRRRKRRRYRSSRNELIIFVRFKKKNSLYLPNNPQISDFMKIRSVGSDLFHAYGRKVRQTDTKKLIVAFRKFRESA
jgi:hypothetical protein